MYTILIQIKADECSSRGGTSAGICAQGYGVCCTFTVACGATISQNCTYLVQEATTNPSTNPCTFTICKQSSDICRIRLDFTTFSIAGPAVGTTSAGDPIPEGKGGSIGDCNVDSFSVTAPGYKSSPVVCGFNSGQHMILDASSFCHKATFDFTGTGSTRQFDIKVTQYNCGDERGGPKGCLQYFTGASGKVASYNFPTTSSTLSSTVTHLSSQCYTMCFRQELGKCAICFTVVSKGSAAIDQGSFGLSVLSAPGADVTALQDSGCTSDYLEIPGSEQDGAPPNAFAVGVTDALGHDRVCGRFFGYSSVAGLVGAANNDESICTQQRPFRMIFKTDADESTIGGTMNDVHTNELAKFPGGIIGFHLHYALQDC
ncbi:uncharacterized protein LOC131876798 isoform X2 [Tigriopus californicus]|uniref:uncharacterized protein LOC131876798 isoform X2 n=1 Tax=Tigriopus californicus TaxID=6832 RepID=UPI0027DA97FA|nr:uncharacterized protein LOC131876798 isoform X2 [Tigriopus californicus]